MLWYLHLAGDWHASVETATPHPHPHLMRVMILDAKRTAFCYFGLILRSPLRSWLCFCVFCLGFGRVLCCVLCALRSREHAFFVQLRS